MTDVFDRSRSMRTLAALFGTRYYVVGRPNFHEAKESPSSETLCQKGMRSIPVSP
jgi:hypothetical protein